jgi:phosphatidylglycerol:prolipoprotein diacylglycerol transferase
MIFPNAQRLSARESWALEIAEKTGIPVPGADAMLNLPRHPSQLYEALFEGVVLWLIIWLVRKKSPFKGFLAGLYIGGYGLIRFFLEYFREPDADLGYRIELVRNGIPPALFSSLFNFTTGQILCFAMILAAVIWWIIAPKLPNHEALWRYTDNAGRTMSGPSNPETREASRIAAKKSRRKLRKKLR